MEMTGLLPEHDRIIEVAIVITNAQLEVVAEAPVLVVHQSDEILAGMDNWNKSTHGKSGLIDKVRASVLTEQQAEQQMLAFLLQPVEFPDAVHSVLGRIGDTMAPLAFLWVGAQLDPRQLGEQSRPLAWGLGWKLIACPLLVIFVVTMHGGLEPLVEQVTVIQSSMPPMIGAAAVAAQAGLAPRLVAALIGVGIPLGLATSSMWYLVYGWVG